MLTIIEQITINLLNLVLILSLTYRPLKLHYTLNFIELTLIDDLWTAHLLQPYLIIQYFLLALTTLLTINPFMYLVSFLFIVWGTQQVIDPKPPLELEYPLWILLQNGLLIGALLYQEMWIVALLVLILWRGGVNGMWIMGIGLQALLWGLV